MSTYFEKFFPFKNPYFPKYYKKKEDLLKRYPKDKIPFSEYPNLFRFDENGKWGIINSNNEVLLAPKYSFIDEFHEGIAIVIIFECLRNYYSCNSVMSSIYFKEKYGLIDHECRLTSEPTFSFIEPFVNGESISTTHHQCLIDRNGKILEFTGGFNSWRSYNIEITANNIKRLSNGFYYLFRSWPKKDGDSQVYEIVNHEKVIIWTGYLFASNDEYIISDYKNGILKISLKSSNKTIFIDEKGQKIFTSYYSFISDCSENLIRFRSNRMKYIIYDINRKCYARIYSDVDIVLNDDVIITIQDNKRKLYNFNGEELHDLNKIIDSDLFDFNFPSFSRSIYFSENMCKVKSKENGLIGYINIKGEVEISPKYNDGTVFKNGYAKVLIRENDENCWYFINKRGEFFYKIGNKSFSNFLQSDPRFVVYKENHNEDIYKIINFTGSIIYEGKIHDYKNLNDDLIAIIIYKSDEPDYVIILNIKEVKHKGIANNIRVHSDGFVELSTHDESTILDKYGDFIYQAKYNPRKINNVFNPIPLEVYINNKYKIIKQDGKHGIMNVMFNSIIINPQYDWIIFPIRHYFIASYNNKYGIYNIKGDVILAPICHSYEFNKGNYLFFVIYQFGFLDILGNLAIEPVYDEATYFENGTSKVSIEGINFFIDINGKRIL